MIVALLIVIGVYCAVLVGKAACAARYAHAHPAPTPRQDFSDVTILQPILGGDPRLADTLASNLGSLPRASFKWLLDNDDAAGQEAARQAHAAVPGALVELVACPPPPADLNPKLFKLAHAERRISTPFLAVLDDDTQLTPAGLTALLDALRTYDVATGLPFYLAGENLPSKLVAQFVNNQSVLTYLPLLVWHPPLTLSGMAYAVPTARWRALGGFAPLVRRLTDDFAVASRVRAGGGRIFQSTVPHAVSTTVGSFCHYHRIMHRWFVFALLLVQAQPVRWRLMILVLHGLPPLLLWCALALAAIVLRWEAGVALLALAVVRGIVLAGVHRRHFGRTLHAPLTSLSAELLQPFHLAHALVSRRIHWRSRVIQVRADDDFSTK
jgi:ceramide glucosyltransferase